MSSALETLLEAARYIELQELRQQNLSQEQNSNPPSTISYTSTTAPSNSVVSSQSGITNLRYNTTVSNNHVSSTSPQISPILQTPIHQIINRNEYNINSSNVIRIDSRHICEEPFLNGHSLAAPPLVVISAQPQQIHTQQQNVQNQTIQTSNQQQHQIQNNQNSLSPPSQQSSTSLSSFEISRSRSSSVSSTNLQQQITPIVGNHINGVNGQIPIANGMYHHSLQSGDDSNQSSLNLSSVSSGYISGGNSANSSIGGNNLNTITNGTTINHNSQPNILIASTTPNGNIIGPETNVNIVQSISSSGRRRTTSTNSNGGTQRSPCILRAGTREVHNKLEKNRRAHLKECFEQLKKQLPSMPEEKKTSNLSILGAAIRYVQSLKRKERELEHEMERLAKEKIAAQQKILLLKRELSSQWDHIDFSTIILENDVENIRDREPQNEVSLLSTSGRGGTRYSSSSSLSSATTSSPCTNVPGVTHSTMPGTMTTISPVIASTVHNIVNIAPNSPRSINSSSPSTSNLPLPLTTTKIPTTAIHHHHHHHHHQHLQQHHHHNQMTDIAMQTLSGGNNKKTINSTISTNSMAINLTTADGISPALIVAPNSTMPLNFSNPSSLSNITTTSNNTTHGQSLQIISTNNNLKELNLKKNGIRVAEIGRQEPTPSLLLNKELGKVEVLTAKLDNDTPPKVIKLINGSTIALASVDKDNKLIASSQTLTLQQVVGGGGLVVSPIPFLASQGLRVIGQSTNGLATIELTTPVTQNQTRNLQTHSSTCNGMTNATTGITTNSAHLHKLLVSGTSSSGTTTTTVTPELARLPGGAELNILPANTNGTTFYRSQKVAIVNNGITLKGEPHHSGSGRAVHVVTPIQSNSTISGLTPIVVPQGQGGTNLAQIVAASSSQLGGKMVTHTVGGQNLPLVTTMNPYVVKPMVVAVASTAATTSSISKTHSISVTSTNSINGGNSA